MTEYQLEKILGGTTKEILRDIRTFKAKGVLPENTPSKDAGALKNAFAKFGIDCIPKEGCYSHENIYSFNGKKISRLEAWQILEDKLNASELKNFPRLNGGDFFILIFVV